jgi:iron complex outermembrane receptor protein
MIAPQSSSLMAGHRGSIVAVWTAWRLSWVLCLAACVVGSSLAAEPHRVYDIDLREQRLADALNGLSEQTGAPVVFPYDLVGNRQSNPVIGRYTLLEALDALLKDTGLSGGLSDKGVLTISQARSGTAQRGETIVTTQENYPNTNKPRSTRSAGIAAFLAAVVAAFSASADEPAADASRIDTVVVSAEKKNERLQDVPVPVTVVSAAALAQNSQVLLRDYYTTVPDFVVQPGILSQQVLAIRGIGTGGGGGSGPTIGVVVDDVPFTGSLNQTGGFWLPDFDPGDLDRIEVLRGPQGTLYGVNSMGGLLKFVSKDPSTEGYSGRLEAGTNSVHNGAEPGFTVRASGNIPLSDSVAVRVSGFQRQDPGYIDNPVRGLNGVNEAHTNGARLAVLWKLSDTFSAKFSALYQHGKSDGASDVNVSLYGGPTGLGDLQQNYLPGIGGYDVKIQAYSVSLNAKLGGIDLTSLTGYNDSQTHTSLDFGYAFGGLVEPVFGVRGAPFIEYNSSPRVSQEVRASIPFGGRFDWLVGVFYSHEGDHGAYRVNAVDEATGSFKGLYWYHTYLQSDRFEEYAGFTDLTWHVTDRLDLQVGGRETHDSFIPGEYYSSGPFVGSTPVISSGIGQTSTSFTYLVTPQFKISQDLMVYARLASGYRPGATNSATPGVPPTSSPDKTKNYEIGLKGEFFDHRLSLDTSVYYIDWKNMQISLLTPVTSLEYFGNGGGSKSEGVEFSITTRPLRGLSVAAWYAYDNAVLTESFPSNSSAYGASGDRLPNMPRSSAHLSIAQDFPLGESLSGFIGGEAGYVDERIAAFTNSPDRLRMPGYTKTDLRAGVKSDSWTINAYVNNVGDVRGLLNGGPGSDPPYGFAYITPRTVGVNIIKTF